MDPVERQPINPPPETEYEPRTNFERAVMDRLKAQQQQIETISQMICPVCGPPIHARNHPDKISFSPEAGHDHQNGTGP
jgi:hypothetical protein